MTRDTGICGTEEYGTCRRCGGTGKVDRDTAPETLMRRVNELESRLTGAKMANGDMILGILDEADKHREKFEAEARDRGIRFNQLIAAAIAQAVSPTGTMSRSGRSCARDEAPTDERHPAQGCGTCPPETNGRLRVLISPVISRAERFRVM